MKPTSNAGARQRQRVVDDGREPSALNIYKKYKAVVLSITRRQETQRKVHH